MASDVDVLMAKQAIEIYVEERSANMAHLRYVRHWPTTTPSASGRCDRIVLGYPPRTNWDASLPQTGAASCHKLIHVITYIRLLHLKPNLFTNMPRPLRKTVVTSLKMTPEVRDLWEQCAAAEDRSLTNVFEVLVRAHAKKLGIAKQMEAAVNPMAKGPTSKGAKK